MVTVIIPTYKRAEFIDRAIESVLNQTYKNFEIIVVDDNNPDSLDRKRMQQIMEKYRNNEKIQYIMHEKNRNGAAARNTGIKIARGDYIAFLDDDDYYMPKRLEIMVKALEENKEYGAAYTSVIIVNKNKIIDKIVANKGDNLQKELLMQKNMLGTGSNLFIRKEILKKLNGFDENFIRHQDIEILIRYFRNYKILPINKVLVIKVHDSRINVPNLEKFEKVKKLFFYTFEEDINKYDVDIQKQIYYNNYYELLDISIQNRNYKSYVKYLKTIKEYKKLSFKDIIRIYWKILNNYVKINTILRFVKNFKYKKEWLNID